MKRVFLCGHTGSENRGCEAILRSTAKLLKDAGETAVYAMTFDDAYDKKVNLEDQLVMIPYLRKPLSVRALSLIRRKFFGDGVWGARQSYRSLFRNVKAGDILFNVGGDTYCSGTPNLSYALNHLAQEHNIPNVFWGCSVEQQVVTNRQMREDINRYRYIVARESISYSRLKEAVEDKNKVLFACDPAFHLDVMPVSLPEGFDAGNTVGLNLSPLVITEENNSDSIMLQNVYSLIDHILEETDMSICLIPHVYDPERNTEDIRVLRKIYARYASASRICIEERCLSCTQIKYIISQCRFFIGARTHSMIAAYSTHVPALAISYSVKSIGIAQDIWGEHEGYAIPWRTITNKDELWRCFSENLLKNEDKLRSRYAEFMPGYMDTMKQTIKILLENIRR